MLKRFDAGATRVGIYAIYVEDKVVYIGQSENLPVRLSTHEAGIRNGRGSASWYSILHQFYRRNFTISCKIIERTDPSQLLAQEEKYIRTLDPLFNTCVGTARIRNTPKNYEEAITLLGLSPREPVKQTQIECEERAHCNGWFGEQYANKDEFFWWEYEQVYGNYKRPNRK